MENTEFGKQQWAAFEREERYVVLKIRDIKDGLSSLELLSLDSIRKRIAEYREVSLRKPLECVVVESDWPEYEVVWKMIEQRVTGNGTGSHPAVCRLGCRDECKAQAYGCCGECPSPHGVGKPCNESNATADGDAERAAFEKAHQEIYGAHPPGNLPIGRWKLWQAARSQAAEPRAVSEADVKYKYKRKLSEKSAFDYIDPALRERVTLVKPAQPAAPRAVSEVDLKRAMNSYYGDQPLKRPWFDGLKEALREILEADRAAIESLAPAQQLKPDVIPTLARLARHADDCMHTAPLPTGDGYWHCTCGLDNIVLDGELLDHVTQPAQPSVPVDDDELCTMAERVGASVEWANDPSEFYHLIKFTPPELRAFIAEHGKEGA